MEQGSLIIVVGTFRTGSSFMSKALSAHPQITVATDPYFMFFKAYRNDYYLQNGIANFDCNSPIDEVFRSDHFDLCQKLLKATLDIPVTFVEIEQTLSSIADRARRASERIIPFLDQANKSNSYKELFMRLVDIVSLAYGNIKDRYTGFKFTFAEQFLNVISNTFPSLKCIYVYRDPRAIAASQKLLHDKVEHRGRYPLLYVIRQWRKSIAYLLYNYFEYQNVLPVRYEDAIKSPYDTFRIICQFLGLEYSEKMIDPLCYIDGIGRTWKQNSSYGESMEITTRYLKKWKSVLSPNEIQFIEDLCAPEMHALGYNRITKDKLVENCLQAPYEDVSQIEPWIMPYIKKYIMNDIEAEHEFVRRILLEKGFRNDIYAGDTKKIIDKYCITPSFNYHLNKFSLNLKEETKR